jgi:hypothetical protein
VDISNFDIQRLLKAGGRYSGALDGDLGPKSMTGIDGLLESRADEVRGSYRRWGDRRRGIAAFQLILKHAGFPDVGVIDGLVGPDTIQAYSEWDHLQREGERLAAWRPDDEPEDGPVVENSWGRQRDMDRRFGPAGGAQCTAGKVDLPFSMRIAWDKGSIVRRFSCHEDVAQSAERVYARVASAYSPEDIRRLGIDLFGGCYNYRKKRGGSTLSTHAYGLAIDTDPERNQLRWNATRARLAKPDAEEFWRCWEAEGWLSLGRARDFDWMHVQAPGL